MAENNYLSHTNLKKKDVKCRLNEAGIFCAGWNEDLAHGHRTPEAVVAGWMSSERHRNAILNPNTVELGIGIAVDSQDLIYYTLDAIDRGGSVDDYDFE